MMTQAVETPRTTIDRAPISCQHNIILDYSLHDVYHATPWCWRFYGLKKHISSRSCQICRPRPTDSHADTSLAFQDIQTHQDMSLTRAEEISGNPGPPPFTSRMIRTYHLEVPGPPSVFSVLFTATPHNIIVMLTRAFRAKCNLFTSVSYFHQT